MRKAFVNMAIRPKINKMTGIHILTVFSLKWLTFFIDESRYPHLKSTQSYTYGLFPWRALGRSHHFKTTRRCTKLLTALCTETYRGVAFPSGTMARSRLTMSLLGWTPHMRYATAIPV